MPYSIRVSKIHAIPTESDSVRVDARSVQRTAKNLRISKDLCDRLTDLKWRVTHRDGACILDPLTRLLLYRQRVTPAALQM